MGDLWKKQSSEKPYENEKGIEVEEPGVRKMERRQKMFGDPKESERQ